MEPPLAWVEKILGGRIIDQRAQRRWRAHWFLTVAGSDGLEHKVLLRGFRNPGYLGDEAMMRAWLRREAGVLRALQPTGVKVPRYYGYDDDGDWLAMEWVQGDELLTEVADARRRGALFREYLDTIADLHQLDPATLELPADLPLPRSGSDVVRGTLTMATMLYRASRGVRAEPLLELGLRWAERNLPNEPHAIAMCAGDIGPNQFIFDGSGVKALFDLELARVGDPYEELGLMRMREMCYPIGDLPSHLRYYAERMGEPLDTDLLQFWTVVGMLSGPLWFHDKVVRPDPLLLDQVSIYSYEPIYRRGIAEALMEIYGIPLDPPAPPDAVGSDRAPFFTLMTGQLREYYLPSASDDEQFRLECSVALAETLAVADAIGPELDAANLDELAEVLGRRPPSFADGMAELETGVKDDPEKDLERRLRFLHRVQVRREFVHEPIQRAMGFASNQPLGRL